MARKDRTALLQPAKNVKVELLQRKLLGQDLKRLREWLGASQGDFCSITGMNHAKHYQSWLERKGFAVSMEVKVKLAACGALQLLPRALSAKA